MDSLWSAASKPAIGAPSRVGLALSLIALCGLVAPGGRAAAEPPSPDTPRMIFSARNAQARLVELYTSEGCSSCPPADRWLGRFAGHPELFRSIVPIAFHVDYWDNLGWPDRFADPAYGERHRRLAALGRVDSVYTPGVFVNGFEWRGHVTGRALPAARPGVVPASIRVRVGDGPLEVAVAGPGTRAGAVVHAALLGSGFRTEVSGGENRGLRLEHAFVVLAHDRRAADATGRARLPLTARMPPGDARFAVAVWVTDPSGDYLQATGSWVSRAEAAALSGAQDAESDRF